MIGYSLATPKLDLEIDFNAYLDIAKNIKRVSLMPQKARTKILDRANKELSTKRKDILNLIDELLMDKYVFEITGFNYARPPEDGFFTTAIADYLLRNKKSY